MLALTSCGSEQPGPVAAGADDTSGAYGSCVSQVAVRFRGHVYAPAYGHRKVSPGRRLGTGVDPGCGAPRMAVFAVPGRSPQESIFVKRYGVLNASP